MSEQVSVPAGCLWRPHILEEPCARDAGPDSCGATSHAFHAHPTSTPCLSIHTIQLYLRAPARSNSSAARQPVVDTRNPSTLVNNNPQRETDTAERVIAAASYTNSSFGGAFYEDDMSFPITGRRTARPSARRFNEYFRCYPVTFMTGPERESLNFGGKVIMPPSALEKLTRLHISYPMLFELRNGPKDKVSHAGVLEFIAEEGRIYLPFWMMNTLLLEPGDLLEVKSTDLPDGQFIKLQPQSVNFLDISDPKAVLENSLRNFSALTKDDIFSFSYNDQIYEIAVLEVKPATSKGAISCVETDIEVDFAPPVGYVEPVRVPKGSSSAGSTRPGSSAGGGLPAHATIHTQGSMSEAIGYGQIAPSTRTKAPTKEELFSRIGAGQRLAGKKGAKNATSSTPTTSSPLIKPATTPIAGQYSNPPPLTSNAPSFTRKTDGPQALRLPHGKLFFGYEHVPLRKRDENGKVIEEEKKPFTGGGVKLSGAAVKKEEENAENGKKRKGKEREDATTGTGSGGVRLGDTRKGKRDIIQID
ncbi:ubiquitin fusion degradation protein UFD1-domain-containing protein [Peziza echinospora]|nr:ubiquitin fusion degradation protein UFD1-domain-containing protein [Peziza echinospora]